ncbi:type IV pili methyl-accepting chemotaxis transducer N-terminal domain-containing protein [Ramlibacter solisilvae]
MATGITFLMLALASIGLTLWVTWNLEGGAAAVNEAGRMRMQTYRMALVLSSGLPDALAQAQQFAMAFDDSLALLATGDPSRPLTVPWSAESRASFDEVRGLWAQLRTRWLQDGSDAASFAHDADIFVAEVDAFVTAIETQIARWTAVLHVFQMALMALAVAGAVAMLYAGYVLVLAPLARLKRGLESVQAGDLSTRVQVDSGDEFGELSAGFNEMARTLQALYGSLESKVREKTEHLEARRQRLADLYEVSAFLSKASTLEELGRGFARQVRRIAHADASAVRWCDEGNQRYLMLATDNLPPELVSAEACLDTGQCHCGRPAADAGTRVIPIRPSDSSGLGHCSRSGFESVVSVPVRLHDKVLGEVNLFYRYGVMIAQDDRDLLDALASHLASAMEGQRAAALEREAAVAGERSLLARELHDSIAQSLAFMKIQVQLLRQAVSRGDKDAASNVLGELDHGVRECYADVRELLMHFRTRTSEEDMEPALRTTLSKFEHQTGLAARLEMDGHGVALAPDVQVQVLHIIQEALSNVRKHARAREVVLRATARPHWRFEVVDDGLGFDLHDARGETQVGLRIMRERAERIGATVRVRSAPGQGCSVSVELPPATSPASGAPAPAAVA